MRKSSPHNSSRSLDKMNIEASREREIVYSD